MTIGVVLLAAGAGRRYHGPTHKLLAAARGEAPLYRHALDAAIDARVGPIVVVTGQARLILPPSSPTGPGIWAVYNPAWAAGQATSLACAVRWAVAADWDAMVVGLADQPGITSSAWQAVAAAAGTIAVATYDGRRRNPVKLGREVWPMLADVGDEGARQLMRMRPELVEEVPCSGRPVDIDTVEDLEKWSSSTTSP